MKTPPCNSASAEKHLVRSGPRGSTLDHVEVDVIERDASLSFLNDSGENVEIPTEVTHLLRMVGRQEVLDTFGCITAALWAENIYRIKTSKAYKKMGINWEQACAKFFPHLSIDTCDRWAQQFGEFGAAFFHIKDVVRISAGVYRQINPKLTDDGKVIIAGEAFALTKTNAGAIQTAIEAQRQQLADKADEAARAKAAANRAQQERAEAKKAEEKAREELLTLKSAERDQTAGADDADHSTIISIHKTFEMCHRKIGTLAAKEMTAVNDARLIGLIEYHRRALAQLGQVVAENKGLGENSAFPVAEEFINDMYPGARNVLMEHVEEMRKRK
jgi:hypothetical protein